MGICYRCSAESEDPKRDGWRLDGEVPVSSAVVVELWLCEACVIADIEQELDL